MEAALIGTMAAGTVIQAASQYQQGQAESAWHKYNAAISERNRQEALQAGAYEEKQFRKQGRAFKAQQLAKIGASGVSLEGTPSKLMEGITGELEKDALMIRRNAQVGAQGWGSQAALERIKGKTARKAGKQRAMGTLFSGAGTLGLYGYESGWF